MSHTFSLYGTCVRELTKSTSEIQSKHQKNLDDLCHICLTDAKHTTGEKKTSLQDCSASMLLTLHHKHVVIMLAMHGGSFTCTASMLMTC